MPREGDFRFHRLSQITFPNPFWVLDSISAHHGKVESNMAVISTLVQEEQHA